MAIFSFAKCITVKVLIATESQRKRKVARTLEGCEWRKCDISVGERAFSVYYMQVRMLMPRSD